MARKKKQENDESQVEAKVSLATKMLPSEWATQEKRNVKFYYYFDEKLGQVTHEEFDKIEV